MAGWILCFIRQVMSSRIGRILLIVHLIVVVITFSQKPPVSREDVNAVTKEALSQYTSTLVAGRDLHYHYESPVIKFLTFLDIPGICVGLIIGLFLIPIDLALPPYESSWLLATALLCGTSIQWILIGYFVERLICRSNHRPV